MRHILVIFTLVGLLAGGGWLWQTQQQVALAESPLEGFVEARLVYLTVAGDPIIKEAESLDVQVITNPDFFAQVIESPLVEAILLHPEVLAYLDKRGMQKAYERGVIVVGINVPLSAIGELTGAKEGAESWMADLDMNYAHEQIALSYVYSKSVLHEGQSTGISEGKHTSFLPNLTIIVEQIVYLLEFDPLTPHYPVPNSGGEGSEESQRTDTYEAVFFADI